MADGKRERGSTIERVLETMEFVSQHDGLYSSDNLAKKLDYPPTSAARLFADLTHSGFLQESLLGRLTLGPECRSTARSALAHNHVKNKRMTLLQSLSDNIGETCGISVPSGASMIYFERTETNWPIQIHLPPGSKVPMTATASGKMYLSGLPEVVQKRVLSHIGLEAFTRNTLMDIPQFMAQLVQIREQGYAIDNEEFIDGMSAVAVPIGNQELGFGYLFCHAPTFRTPVQLLLAHIDEMHCTADNLLKAMLKES